MRRLATRSVIWKKKDYTWIRLMTKPTNWHVFTARMKKAWVLSYSLRGQRSVSLQVLRFCDFLFYPCSVQHCDPLAMESFAGCLLVCPCLWFHVLSNLLLLLRRIPCTLLMLTSPFVLTARELSRYTCTCSMPIKSLFGTGIYAILLYKEPCRTLLTAIF